MSIEQSPVTAEWKMIVNFVLKLCPRFQVLASQFSGPGLPFKNAVVVGFSDKEVHPQAEPCRLSDGSERTPQFIQHATTLTKLESARPL